MSSSPQYLFKKHLSLLGKTVFLEKRSPPSLSQYNSIPIKNTLQVSCMASGYMYSPRAGQDCVFQGSQQVGPSDWHFPCWGRGRRQAIVTRGSWHLPLSLLSASIESEIAQQSPVEQVLSSNYRANQMLEKLGTRQYSVPLSRGKIKWEPSLTPSFICLQVFWNKLFKN